MMLVPRLIRIMAPMLTRKRTGASQLSRKASMIKRARLAAMIT